MSPPLSHTQKPWGHYERLRPGQIEEIRDQHAIAYVPWGALEWHSYHNPIGLDNFLALGLSEALAQRTGGIVLPPMYAGTDTIKPFKGFAHSIEFSARVVEMLSQELLQQLYQEQFRTLILVTGHCGKGHTDALSASVAAFNEEENSGSALLIPSFEPIKDSFPPNHAALGETSFQLLFDPSLVDVELLPKNRVATLDDDGVWGQDPRKSSSALGQRMLSLFCERCVPQILNLDRSK